MKILHISVFMFVMHSLQATQSDDNFFNPRPNFLDMNIRVVQGQYVPGTDAFSEVKVPVFTPKDVVAFNDAVQQSETIWAQISDKPGNLRQLRMLPVYQNASHLVQEALEYQWYIFVFNVLHSVSARDFQAMANNIVCLVKQHHYVLC